MRGTFLLLAAVSRTLGFVPTHNLRRIPSLRPIQANTDGAAEKAADSTDETAEETAEEDADAAILRKLEQEVNRLDAARQECERTITRLFAELDAAQIDRAKTVQAYERAYNRYQQTKGIQEQLQASRRKAEARKQSLDGVDVVAAAAALKSRPQVHRLRARTCPMDFPQRSGPSSRRASGRRRETSAAGARK